MPRSSLPNAEARLLKALAHPVRIQIAMALAQEESCVCHLEARLHLRQAYLSQQLGVMHEAGLLSERRVGTFVYHRLANPKLRDVIRAARAVTGSRGQPIPRLDPTDCACPRCGDTPRAKSRPPRSGRRREPA